jgi:hypothetical protein
VERSGRHFISVRKRVSFLLEGSQALSAGPSDVSSMEVKTLGWQGVEAWGKDNENFIFWLMYGEIVCKDK